MTATASDQRAQAYGDLQDLLVEEGSAFPIYERVWQAATSQRVQHFRWTAEGFALLGDIELKKP
jgi:peptide/nickel transport system substrate-binding protein